MTSDEIRRRFLDFFAERGHHILASAPIVVKNDPTLLFTNAGMNQFKDYFLGHRIAEYKRVADTQKCLRVSGKHNDLEEVGTDTYHHTMFEMLGNWSFGDYFKKEAIAWSWELLTVTYGLPKDRLYVSVFGGDQTENLPRDEEALAEWKKWLDPERILFGSKKDNFWEMGDTGPCGPCTEIHMDCRTEQEIQSIPGKDLVNRDHSQVIEIWNNVFIQFNRLKDGSLKPLPSKHVDTGMGLERLVRVIQKKQSNYDTDLFAPVIGFTEQLSHRKYQGTDSKADVAFRVIADHIRAICFTIADGQLPSNTGAGYVIRRILRRAVRYYYSFFEIRTPLLHLLVPVLANQFSQIFPELKAQEEFVKKVVFEEEESFLRTIQSGMSLFQSYIRDGEDKYLKASPENQLLPIKADNGKIYSSSNWQGNKKISGEFAFDLYDTFGFPLDLTRLLARELGWEVDEEGFLNCMQQQKTRSREATALDTGDWVILSEGGTLFTGYQDTRSLSSLRRYRKLTGKGKEQYQLVLDITPFYAESGGQSGDTGTLDFSGQIIPVTDTKKENELIVHFTDKLPDNLYAKIQAAVDTEKQQATRLNHSATHLLHAALRQVLGKHVQQKGSLVNQDYLRFDFSHFAKITEAELEQIETRVNSKIRENIPVMTSEMKKEEALQTGAMALFGEKYGELVRVVTIDPDYSIELCGGTHVSATGEIGYFKILSESGIAAGVRRIEAVTGKAADTYIHHQLNLLSNLGQLVKNQNDPLKAVEQLLNERSVLEKKLETFESQTLEQQKNQLLQQAEIVHGTPFIGQILDHVANPDSLKKLCFALKGPLKNGVVVLAAEISGKAHLALMINDTLVSDNKWDASQIIRTRLAPLIKGGGGGQPNLATAGGADASFLTEAIGLVRSML